MAGAEPVVIDVELATWNLAPSLLRQFITTQTCAAVVLVSPFGLHCDFSEQIEICRGHGIPVVIDSAAGLSQKGQPLIDERCFEIYSLHATKPFPIGEGGAIRSWASQAPALRRALNFGLEGGRGQLGCWGINGKLPEVSAAIGLAVLSEFDAIVRHRQAIAGRYIECLREYPALVFPSHLDHSPWQVFPVLLPSASAAEIFIQRAGAERLQIRWSYKPTLDNWPRTRRSGACPNAQSLAERMVTLPVYSDMTKDELSEILGIVQRSLDHALQA